MAKKKPSKKKTTKKKVTISSGTSTSSPKLPYSNTANALRKFLRLVPDKPKPTKVNNELLSAWELGGSNSNSIIRVLKALNLVSAANDPTDDYEKFMHRQGGPQHLAVLVRDTYKPLFEASHTPHRESDETLRNLFNIHSGGSDSTLSHQIATFKAVCEFADFENASLLSDDSDASGQVTSNMPVASNSTPINTGPAIHIDLHIHLPENKSSRDYQAIIEDIGRYIYGKDGDADE